MKRIVEKQCPICGKVTYMVIDAENYDQVMEYMVALYFNTKRKVVQKALPFLDKFGREFIKSGYCPECQEDLFNSVLEDKSSYFSCSDIDNEVLDEFFEVVYKIGAVNALCRLIKQILYQCIRSSILPMHLKFGNGCRWTILVRLFWFPKFPKMRKGNLDI